MTTVTSPRSTKCSGERTGERRLTAGRRVRTSATRSESPAAQSSKPASSTGARFAPVAGRVGWPPAEAEEGVDEAEAEGGVELDGGVADAAALVLVWPPEFPVV